MEKYIRKCPKCNKDIEHKRKSSRNQCDKQKRLCKSCGFENRNQDFMKTAAYKQKMSCSCCGENNGFYGKKHSEQTKEKFKKRDLRYRQEEWYKQLMSKSVSGSNNPMYGVSVYDVWLKKYGKEQADILQEELKQKRRIQCSGAGNPMYGKPSPQGSGNGWSGWYNGVFFRSLKELAYMVENDKQGVEWITTRRLKLSI